MIELKIPLQPKQRLFKESIEKYPITLFGGARGGGKSYALRNIFLLRAFQYPGSTSAIFRKTFPELDANHIRPLFQQHPFLRQYYNESKKLLALPNGSVLQFCHCENEKDVALQQGREIQNLGIDEAGTWLESTFRTLLGSNRSSNPKIPSRCALTANPGNVGHQYLKRLFIERRFKERERQEDYHFIQSLIADNPALMESDPDYVHRLNSETNEAIRRAYLYGDWDTLAGAYFSEITREIHLIKPFAIPPHWNRFGAYDYGYNHPAAFGWFANDEDGNTYLYRELVQAQTRVDQFAHKLNSFSDTNQLYPIVAGHDCWTTKGVLRDDARPPTVAEEFQTHGINLKRAVIDRIQGAAHLRSYLAWRGKPGNKPRFYIFDTCPIAFDTLSRMIHDPDRVEDVLKVDATEGDPLSGDDCFARGTLIATASGERPIESLQRGDMVWTRQGLKPVVDAWLNAINRETLRLTLSNGRTIQATANHKIWDGKEFRSLDTFKYGNIVECLNQKPSSSMGLNSAAIPPLSALTCETITGLLGTTASEVWARCMSRYGNQLTARSPRGYTFITPMGIHSTINWKIWCRSILRLIAGSISKTQSEWQRLVNTFSALDHWLVPGIEAQLVANGTVRMLYAPGLNEKGSRHVVWSAPENFIHLIQKRLSSAIKTANNATEPNKDVTQSVLSAKKILNIPSMLNPFPELVRLNVEQICDGERSDTYSIHVADCHEYFANNILVLNCYDMIRYGLMSRPAITDKLAINHPIGSPGWYNQQSEEIWEREREKLTQEQGNWSEIPANPWGNL